MTTKTKTLISLLLLCLVDTVIPLPIVARIVHEPPAATVDMAVIPGVLGCRTLRRTVKVRLGSNPLR